VAIVTTTKQRTITVVYTGDSAVTLHEKAHESRLARAKDRRVRQALAELPAGKSVAELAEAADKLRAALPADFKLAAWVPVDECAASTGATKAKIRGLSWLEDQEAQTLAPAELMRRTIELGLLALDDDEDAAARFKADPVAALWTPLYHAIAELTWGN
jgi:hypothetical protein